MRIKVLVITYNRPGYTEQSLEQLCRTAPPNLKLTIWDNASDQETRDVVAKFENRPCVERMVFNAQNDKLRKPTNWFWENSRDADLIGKVDDDCLVPSNWCSVLEQAHRDIPRAGVLGCWRFLPEDYRHEKAVKKIEAYGHHQVMRNCWVEGSGYLMKREIVDALGVLQEEDTFTDYCIKAAAKGYINGWYYPFLYQEHMDDPRAPHSGIRTEEDFHRLIPLSARNFKIKTREDWIQRLMRSAQRLQEYSFDPYDFIGVKAKIKRKVSEMVTGDYFPKAR